MPFPQGSDISGDKRISREIVRVHSGKWVEEEADDYSGVSGTLPRLYLIGAMFPHTVRDSDYLQVGY